MYPIVVLQLYRSSPSPREFPVITVVTYQPLEPTPRGLNTVTTLRLTIKTSVLSHHGGRCALHAAVAGPATPRERLDQLRGDAAQAKPLQGRTARRVRENHGAFREDHLKGERARKDNHVRETEQPRQVPSVAKKAKLALGTRGERRAQARVEGEAQCAERRRAR